METVPSTRYLNLAAVDAQAVTETVVKIFEIITARQKTVDAAHARGFVVAILLVVIGILQYYLAMAPFLASLEVSRLVIAIKTDCTVIAAEVRGQLSTAALSERQCCQN